MITFLKTNELHFKWCIIYVFLSIIEIQAISRFLPNSNGNTAANGESSSCLFFPSFLSLVVVVARSCGDGVTPGSY